MRLLAALLLVLLPLSATAVEVLASVRPLALIAAAVTGSAGSVRQLLPPGASAHHYQLRPADRIALARADLVLWVGPAHEQFLARVLAGQPRLLTAQRLPGISLKLKRRPDGDSALPGTVDAHVWLDTDNAVVIARALAEALAARDPSRAALYRRNANAFANRLGTFETREAQRFQRLRSRSYLAYHDAYQYLEPTLGLNFRGSLLSGDEDRPGARHFLLMSQRIRKEGLYCLLGEPGFDQALARHVFNGLPGNLVTVDELFAQAPLEAGGFEAGLGRLSAAVYRCLGGQ
ncbi:MAG: periplasmic solute binding protein [Moraxellaceae bacterium]|jgi:zinc transport system substrate-binding protein|nr:periplasmic solute binding protein [Moraxellaceae bacterium]